MNAFHAFRAFDVVRCVNAVEDTKEPGVGACLGSAALAGRDADVLVEPRERLAVVERVLGGGKLAGIVPLGVVATRPDA